MPNEETLKFIPKKKDEENLRISESFSGKYYSYQFEIDKKRKADIININRN